MARLQWFAEDEARYKQESPNAVSKRAKILLEGLRAFRGKRCDPETLDALVKFVGSKISNTIAKNVLKDELRTLVNSVLTPEKTVWIACAIAGGYFDASMSMTIGAFSNDREAVDCLARVEDVVLDDSLEDRVLKVHILFCNSVFAGGKIRADLYLKSFGRWTRLLNLSKPRTGVRCLSPKMLVGAEMIARVERVAGEFNLIGVTVNDRIADRNLKLSRARSREHTPCPFGATWDCAECEVGRNQCGNSCLSIKTDHKLIEVVTSYHEQRDLNS